MVSRVVAERCFNIPDLVYIFLSAGTFKLVIEFSEEYPNKPPTVRFISKMFHPNGELLEIIMVIQILC